MRQEMKLLLIVGGLGILGLSLTYSSLPEIAKADAFARYSYVNSIIISILIGVYFWVLQKKDSDRLGQLVTSVKELAVTQNNILQKIDEREQRRKQFWLGEAIANLQSTLNFYIGVIDALNKFKSKNITNAVALDYLNDNYKLVNLSFLPQLDRAMAQMADLLDNPLVYRNIANLNKRVALEDAIQHLTDYDNDKISSDIGVMTLMAKTMSEYIVVLETEKQGKPSKPD